MLPDALQPAAGHRFLAGVASRARSVSMNIDPGLPKVDREISLVSHVIKKVVLDHRALVAAADHEVVQAMTRVELHDVLENRAAANSCVRTGLDERQLRTLVNSYPASPALSRCGFKTVPDPL